MNARIQGLVIGVLLLAGCERATPAPPSAPDRGCVAARERAAAGWDDFGRRIARRHDEGARSGRDAIEMMTKDATRPVPPGPADELGLALQGHADAAKAALVAVAVEAAATDASVRRAREAAAAWRDRGDAGAAQQGAITDADRYVATTTAAVMARVAYMHKEIALHAALITLRPAKADDLAPIDAALARIASTQRRDADAEDVVMRAAIQQRSAESAAAHAACGGAASQQARR